MPRSPGRGTGTLCALGVWRSLVARSVRVGEVPSSNLGTPIRAGEPMVPPRLLARGVGVRLRRAPAGSGRRRSLGLAPILGRAAGRPLRRRLHALPARAGARARGVPAGRGGARARARPRPLRGGAPRRLRGPAAHPELVHDEEIWIAFTEDIVRGMGGDADGARACAAEIVRRWEVHANFDLYDDALPAARGAPRARPPDRAGLERPARPRGVRAPPRPRRRRRRRLEEPRPTKPHASIFESALAALERRRGGGRDGRRLATRTTSRAPARSGCARSCSTATALPRASPTGSPISCSLPAALGLAALARRCVPACGVPILSELD